MKHEIVNDDASPPATAANLSMPARELAQRLSGSVEILLLWHSATNGVELSVRDVATGAGFQLEVAPADAIDAFYHPYAYAANRHDSSGVLRAETSLVDL